MKWFNANKSVVRIACLAVLPLALITACVSSPSSGPRGTDGRACLQVDWLAESLSNTSVSSLTNLANACSKIAQSDIKPSSADLARYNAAQLFYAAAQNVDMPTKRADLLGKAISHGRPVLDRGVKETSSHDYLILIRAVYGSQMELGLMDGVSRICSTRRACLKSGIDGLDANAGSLSISDGFASGKSALQNAAADLQMSHALSRAELVRLQSAGSVHLSLENLQDLARRADRFSSVIAAAAVDNHSQMAVTHAELAFAREDYTTAAEYLDLAARFSEERSVGSAIRASQNMFLGEMLVLKASYRGNSSASTQTVDLCDAANAFQGAFSLGDQVTRASARRGYALSHALITRIQPGACGASASSALSAYREADTYDVSSRLPRIHIDTFASLLNNPGNDPRGSLDLKRRSGGTSRLDAVLMPVTSITPRPPASPVITLTMPDVSTWPLNTSNTDVLNHMMLARQSRQIGRPADAIAHYEDAVAADRFWPTSFLELGDYLIQQGNHAAAGTQLTMAANVAEMDKAKYARPFAHASYLIGRNELLKLRQNLAADKARALNASRRSADSSAQPLYERQACLAALVAGSRRREEISYCDARGQSPADLLFSAFGKIRKMQIALQLYNSNRYNETNHAAFLERADEVETAVRNVDGVNRATRVRLPITRSEFSFGNFADIIVFIGERCQKDQAELPAIANNAEMRSLLKLMKIDTCDG